MPIIKSAIKRVRQAATRRDRNVGTKRAIKLAVKAFTAEPNQSTLASAQSAIDTAVKKNVLEKATAARRKSALVKLAKAAGVKPAAAKKAKAATKPAAKPATKKPVAKPTTAAAKAPAVKKPAAKPAAKK